MGVVEFAAKAIDSVVWPLTLVVFLLVFRSGVRKILDELSERIKHMKSFRGPAGVSADFDSRVLEAREDARALSVAGQPQWQQAPPAPDAPKIPPAPLPRQGSPAQQAPPASVGSPAQQAPPASVGSPAPQAPPGWLPLPSAIDSGDLAQIEDFDVENLAFRAERMPRSVIIESWLYLEEALRDAGRKVGIQDADRMPVSRLLRLLEQRLESRQLANAAPVIQELRALRNDAAHDRGMDLSPLAAHEYALTALRLALLVKAMPIPAR